MRCCAICTMCNCWATWYFWSHLRLAFYLISTIFVNFYSIGCCIFRESLLHCYCNFGELFPLIFIVFYLHWKARVSLNQLTFLNSTMYSVYAQTPQNKVFSSEITLEVDVHCCLRFFLSILLKVGAFRLIIIRNNNKVNAHGDNESHKIP